MVSCSSVRNSITTPRELLTCCHQRIGVYSVCDRQLQRNGILKTLGIGSDVIMIACSSVRNSITTPRELLTCCHQRIGVYSVCDRQLQRNGILKTLGIGSDVIMIACSSVRNSITTPRELLTCCHQRIGVYSVCDRQLQRNGILKTLGIGSDIIMVATDRVSLSITTPRELRTCCHQRIGVYSVCDRQLQRNGILTTLGIGSDVIMVACSSVRNSITTPRELLTCCHQRIGVYSVCDRQLQRNGILTTLGIGSDVIMVACSSVRNSITTPRELLTCCHQRIGVYSVCDRQLQRNGILTTLGIGSDIIMVATDRVSLSITTPRELRTCCHQRIGVYSVCDRQLQRNGILTTLGIGSDVIMVACSSVRNSITTPRELLTCCHQRIGVYSVCDRQLQRNGILTTLGIGSDIIMVATDRVSLSITTPRELRTCCHQRIGVYSVCDRQLQRNGILTTLGIGSDVIMVACSSVRNSITTPRELLTCCHQRIGVYSVCDRQLQRNGILTTLGIGSDVIMVACSSVRNSITTPRELLTCCHQRIGVYSVCDRQLQRNGILTTLGIGSDIIMVATDRVSLSITTPRELRTCCHQRIGVYSVCDRQLQRNGILTTLGIGSDVIMVACSSVRNSITTPRELLTCCHQRIGVYSVCDRQLQRNGILTTLGIGSDVIMVACSSVRNSITTPRELLTCCHQRIGVYSVCDRQLQRNGILTTLGIGSDVIMVACSSVRNSITTPRELLTCCHQRIGVYSVCDRQLQRNGILTTLGIGSDVIMVACSSVRNSITTPRELLTCCHQRIGVYSVCDRQLQRNGILTTLGIGSDVIMVACSSVRNSITTPRELLTCCHQRIGVYSVCDRQLQRNGILTTLGIGSDVIMVACSSVRNSITTPLELLTCCHQRIGVYSVCDRQLQRNGILTTLGIGSDVIMVACSSRRNSITSPRELLTCCHQRIGVYSVCDRQLQRNGILTTLGIGSDVIMVACSSVRLSITTPGELLTCCHQRIGVYSVCDRQLQRNGILTTLCIGNDVIMVSCSSVRLSITTPGELLTCCHQRIGVYSVCDRQLQRNGILTTLCIGSDVIMVACSSVRLSVTTPGELLTCCQQSFGVYSGCDRQLQRNGILTTLCIGNDVIMVACSSVRLSITTPGELLTCCHQRVGVHSVCDRQLQRNGILTTLCIGSDVIMVACSSVRLSVTTPGELLTCSNQRIGVCSIVDRQLQRNGILTTLCIG